MPIETLEEPVWEKQKGETPNQYCYFLEFLEFPTFNLKDFHNHLCELHKKSQKFTDKSKITSYDVIRKWAGESCNMWKERKRAKRASEKEDKLETLQELDKADAIEEYILKKEINHLLLNRIKREVNEQPMSQINQGIQGYKTLKDDNRVDKGEATEFTNTKIDADIDANVEAQTKLETDFQKAYQDLIDTTRKNSLHIDDDS